MGRQREHTADPLKILSGNQPEDGGGASETTSHPCQESESERGVERERCRDCNCNCAVPWAIKSILNWDRPALWGPPTPPPPPILLQAHPAPLCSTHPLLPLLAQPMGRYIVSDHANYTEWTPVRCHMHCPIVANEKTTHLPEIWGMNRHKKGHRMMFGCKR